jgi:hypothetical protein
MPIGYERLFNMGNFEHDKFVVSKEAESEREVIGLVRAVARLEKDIQRFRKARSDLQSVKEKIGWLRSEEEKKEKPALEKKAKALEKIIGDFKSKHQLLEKACRCAFCTGEWEDDEWDYV